MTTPPDDPRADEGLVEAVGLALLNDDRTRNGYPAVTGLGHLNDEDAYAYRQSARAALAAARSHGGDVMDRWRWFNHGFFWGIGRDLARVVIRRIFG